MDRRFWLALPLLLAAAAILFVRLALGFQFPVPWPDETGFIAQGFALAYNGTLFDPGLNPDRIEMWMPPGYMVVLAACFRLFGYSFALCRWVSTICSLASLAMAGALAWRVVAGWRRAAALVAVAGAFLSPYMLLAGNFARMEALFCTLILLALTACLRQRIYAAISLVMLAGLVHFNAVYFLPGLAAALALQWRAGTMRRPDRAAWLGLAAAAICVGLYGVLVARNWPGFIDDMRFQFTLKRFVSHNDPAHPMWIVLLAVALAGAAIWRARTREAWILAPFGAGFVVMAHAGHEYCYDYGVGLGFALLCLGLLQHAATGAQGRLEVAAMVAVTWMMAFRMIPAMAQLLPSPAMLQRPLVAPSEIAKVRHFIGGLAPGATVDFGWSGMEPFFFDDLRRVGARWQIARHSVIEHEPYRTSDWRVVCDSSELPPMSVAFDMDHKRRRADSGCAVYPGR